MDTHTWKVRYRVGRGDVETVENFDADAFQVGVDGTLALVNDPNGRQPFLTRAFANGVWKEIHLYA